MKRNVGTIDRVARVLFVAPLAAIGAVAAGTTTPLGLLLAAVAAIMVVTAMVGFCPLYALFGINTCPLAHEGR